MKLELEILTKWYFFIPTIIAFLSLLWSIFNFIVGKATAHKILTNDLYHVNLAIKELKDQETDFKKEIHLETREAIKDIKEEEKEFKKEIKEDIHKIFLGIKRIESKQIKRDAICETRHKNDK